jgi:hypothetical protein
MIVKIRLIGRFVLWCLLGLLSRTVGSKSFLGGYWQFTKTAFEEVEAALLIPILVLAPLASMIVTMGLMLAFDYPHDQVERGALIAFCSNMLWVAAAGVSVLWDRFIYEYEESFRILKEDSDV